MYIVIEIRLEGDVVNLLVV